MAYYRPFSVKSNYGREHAQLVAAAASLGYITSRHIDGCFGHSWYVTVVGLDWLHQMEEECRDALMEMDDA